MQRLDYRSRMSGDVHVRFCESLRGWFPWATRLVVHCRSRQQLEMIKQKIEKRLEQCRLRLNPQKTRIVYCKDSKRTEDGHCSRFDFLGYTFRPRSARNNRGEFFVSFSPAMSQKAACKLRRTIKRDWKLKSRTHLSLNEVARRINPVVTGWINYYGKFCRSAIHTVLNHVNMALAQWAMRKFKRLRRHKTRAHV